MSEDLETQELDRTWWWRWDYFWMAVMGFMFGITVTIWGLTWINGVPIAVGTSRYLAVVEKP